jgi:hypothetical protein
MLESNGKQSHSPKIIVVQYSLTKWLTQGLWGCLFSFKIFIFIYFRLMGISLFIVTKYYLSQQSQHQHFLTSWFLDDFQECNEHSWVI